MKNSNKYAKKFTHGNIDWFNLEVLILRTNLMLIICDKVVKEK